MTRRADTFSSGEPIFKNLLEVSALKKHFPIRKGLMGHTAGYVFAVDGIDFCIPSGSTLGLVGESGCGKTTVGRCLLRLHEPTAGRIVFKGEDICHLKGAELTRFRTKIQMIFQDPFSSLNPRMKVRDIVGECLKVHGIARGAEQRQRVAELLGQVGLQERHMSRYPHEFSGGQRQRIGIARALALSPDLIVADEPVSALDVSIQAAILNLLDALKNRLGLTLLIIAHDLAVVEHISDRIAVMYLGKIVETASDRELYLNPCHPYTEALLKSIPKAQAGVRRKHRAVLMGDVPSPINPPAGCRFHTRCPRVKEICKKEEPPMVETAPDHQVACFLYT